MGYLIGEFIIGVIVIILIIRHLHEKQSKKMINEHRQRMEQIRRMSKTETP